MTDLTDLSVLPESQITGSTTLQLVNRVLRNLGQPDVGAVSTENRSAMALDHINAAARDHFDSHDWDWLVRHDGYLKLEPKVQGAWLAITNVLQDDGVTRASILPTTVSYTNTLFDNVGAYAIVNDDSKWDNMMVKMQGVSVTSTGFTSVTLVHAWHTSGLASTDTGNLDVLFPEYIMGSEVKSITSARFQQEEIVVQMIDPDTSFDRAVPNPSTRSGPPEWLGIGGRGTQTIDNGSNVANTVLGTAATPGLRVFVWPIPDDDYIVNFSYTERFKALTDPLATSPVTSFDGVPEDALDKIVDRATGTMMLKTPTSDLRLGAANLALASDASTKAAAAARPDKGRRFSLMSMDRVGRHRRRRRQDFGELLLDGGEFIGDPVL